MASLWRPTHSKGIERRRHPRIPLAVPVRYVTDKGNAGVGVLIDVHCQGAGLLVPHIAADAVHIWMQFLWFDNTMGAQGRVASLRETPDGFHVGVGLHAMHPESTDFVADVLIPFGLRKFKYDRMHPLELLDGLPLPRRDAKLFRRRWRYRPVLVEQGTLKVWAIAEDRNAAGVVLLLPHLPQAQACLNITPWGSFVARRATVIRSTTLDLPPVTLYRVGVLLESEPADRNGQSADRDGQPAAVSSGPPERISQRAAALSGPWGRSPA